MKQITKEQALELFTANKEYADDNVFTICASNMDPNGMFAMEVEGLRIRENTLTSIPLYSEDPCVEAFERYLANFSFYNCDEETGKDITYWV